ncbi:glycosyltransferase family 2 protein [Polaromonas sp. SM01]|uniref:glycosyltransferase family A protein n=1 Tax=Polaromonas sp. SM01 TaxID=3085630 RepID=UPI002981ED67|nr:glycosyltransferase family 2 protein [Polaromonas sp. SM01]MDW5443943.1 glycosyltransferase family 2 protein [Polaromonas sp. SM01]
MNPDSPLVTIGLSIYNGGATLADAVNSIRAQTYENWELILIDDGSRDESTRIAKSFLDPRILALSDGMNKGLSVRLNEAVEMAQGKYFCRMDQDDIAFPHRLAAQVEFLEAHPDVDLLASSVVVFRDDGSLTGVIEVSQSHETIGRHPWKGFYFPHPSWMGRKSWFAAHRYVSAADGAEDQLLLYSTFDTSRFAGLREVLLAYREDGRSFRKMFMRRLVFWRAIGKNALARRKFLDAVLLSILQPLRIAGDFLNIGLRVKPARNTLGPVDAQTASRWTDMWRNIRTDHSSAAAEYAALERK